MTLTADDIIYIRLEINDRDSRIFTDEELQLIANNYDDLNLVIAHCLENILANPEFWQTFTGGNLNYNPNSAVMQRIEAKIRRLRQGEIVESFIEYPTLE